MTRLKKLCLFVLYLFVSQAAMATEMSPSFKAGKEYKTLPEMVYQDSQVQAIIAEHPDQSTIVLQFFSYGCHWCHTFEPSMQAWEQSLPESVVFIRVPVVFQPSWRSLAKAYYTMDALDQLGTMHTAFFDAVQTGSRELGSDDGIRRYFIKHGIEAAQFDSVYQSFSMSRQLEESNTLMRTFQVMAIPFFVVIAPDQTIYATSSLVNPDEAQLVSVLNYLLTQASSGLK